MKFFDRFRRKPFPDVFSINIAIDRTAVAIAYEFAKHSIIADVRPYIGRFNPPVVAYAGERTYILALDHSPETKSIHFSTIAMVHSWAIELTKTIVLAKDAAGENPIIAYVTPVLVSNGVWHEESTTSFAESLGIMRVQLDPLDSENAQAIVDTILTTVVTKQKRFSAGS